jgi:uncharacterized protein DUF222/HNH endonuclease
MFGPGAAEAERALVKTPEEMGESLIRRRHELDVQELLWSIDAARFLATDEGERQGFSSSGDYLRLNCHMTTPQVLDRIDVGQQVAKMPESFQAVMRGEIGFGHLVQMAKTAAALEGSPTASKFEEAPLLAHAKEESVGRLHYTCLHARHSLDPQRYAEDEAETVELRSLEIKAGGDGMASVSGYLDSAGAAILRKALEPLARKSGKDDCRKRKQRLADALVELACGGKPAQIQVTTSVETLVGLAGASAAEMDFSLPISARTVERMACDCNVVRVLLAADSSVIDVGRSTRVITAAMKRALLARDGGCRWPGCDRAGHWCEGHHLVYWTRGGTTELDNLVLLCHRHHRLVHECGWQLVNCDGREGGPLLALPPPTPLSTSRPRGPD